MTDFKYTGHSRDALSQPYNNTPQMADPYADVAYDALTAGIPYGTGPKPVRYVSDGRYRRDVMRNLDPSAFHPEIVSLGAIKSVMAHFVEVGSDLDRIKKALIYGRYASDLAPRVIGDTDFTVRAGDDANFNSIPPQIVHAIIGMATEASEMVEALLKTIETGKPFDQVNFVEEVGDELWYAQLGVEAVDRSLDDAAWTNTRKLAVRYPDKFTSHAALNRNLEAERAVLESSSDRIDVV